MVVQLLECGSFICPTCQRDKTCSASLKSFLEATFVKQYEWSECSICDAKENLLYTSCGMFGARSYRVYAEICSRSCILQSVLATVA